MVMNESRKLKVSREGIFAEVNKLFDQSVLLLRLTRGDARID